MVAVGVNKMIIVETSDAIMIADASQSEAIKHVVEELEKTNITQVKKPSKSKSSLGYI